MRGICLPGQVRCGQVRVDQIRSDQIRSDQIRSDQIRSDQCRLDQIRSEYIQKCYRPSPNEAVPSRFIYSSGSLHHSHTKQHHIFVNHELMTQRVGLDLGYDHYLSTASMLFLSFVFYTLNYERQIEVKT